MQNEEVNIAGVHDGSLYTCDVVKCDTKDKWWSDTERDGMVSEASDQRFFSTMQNPVEQIDLTRHL